MALVTLTKSFVNNNVGIKYFFQYLPNCLAKNCSLAIIFPKNCFKFRNYFPWKLKRDDIATDNKLGTTWSLTTARENRELVFYQVRKQNAG